jgi:branched-chain amino acid aminotransferase
MKTTLTQNKKQKPDFTKLGFGRYFTDHMLVMDYKDGAWQAPEIVPYANFALDPSTSSLHYGQGIFEGMKAYMNKSGKITLFRPRDNFLRMNRSAKRLSMPQLDVDTVLNALKELIILEKEWIPTDDGTSLYIRPTMIATDPFLGVAAAGTYKFFIILSPVGSYYANGLAPTKILVEESFVRAPIGGTGEAKCMGNYAATLLAGQFAKQKGFDQVLWLDAREHKTVEEVGSMNIFFVIDGVVKTPALQGSILQGITRDSAIKLLKAKGYTVVEEQIDINTVAEATKLGTLTESFGTGTAAVIAPVGILNYKGNDFVINNNQMGTITSMLYSELTGIQYGKNNDTFGWVIPVN